MTVVLSITAAAFNAFTTVPLGLPHYNYIIYIANTNPTLKMFTSLELKAISYKKMPALMSHK